MPPLSFLCPTFAMSSVLVLSSGARTLAGATLLRRKRGLRDEPSLLVSRYNKRRSSQVRVHRTITCSRPLC